MHNIILNTYIIQYSIHLSAVWLYFFLILTLNEHKMNNHLGLLSLCWSIAPVRAPRLTLPAWPFWFCHTFPPHPCSFLWKLFWLCSVWHGLPRLENNEKNVWAFLHGLIIALLVLRAFLWPPLHAAPSSCLADRCRAVAPTARSMKLFTDDLSSGRSSRSLVWLNSKSQSYNYTTNLLNACFREENSLKTQRATADSVETTCRCYLQFRSVTLASYLDGLTAISLSLYLLRSERERNLIAVVSQRECPTPV